MTVVLSERLGGTWLRLFNLFTDTCSSIIYPTASSVWFVLMTIGVFVGIFPVDGVVAVLVLPPEASILVPAPLKLISLFRRSNQKGAPKQIANAVMSHPISVSRLPF